MCVSLLNETEVSFERLLKVLRARYWLQLSFYTHIVIFTDLLVYFNLVNYFLKTIIEIYSMVNKELTDSYQLTSCFILLKTY